jgi:hypothetical protein
MKTIASLTMLICATLTSAFCEQPKQTFSGFKIQLQLKGVEEKWLSGLPQETLSNLRRENGTIGLPSMMSKIGFPTDLKIIQEYTTSLGAPVIPCGLTFNINPGFDGEKIRVSGTSMLRYPTNKTDFSTASKFVSQENIIELTLQNGVAKSIDLQGGGQVLITVTMIDATGLPMKNRVEQAVHGNTH